MILLRIWVELVFDNPVGHWAIKHVFWPAMENGVLPVCYRLLRALGPRVAKLPYWIRSCMEKCILLFSTITNCRLILNPTLEVIATFATISIGVKYNQQQRDDMELFLRLGTSVRKESGVWERHFKANMLSGNLNDPENRFFPETLKQGIRERRFWTQDASDRQIHGRIAKTCIMLSILSYQTDKTIRECMAKAGMLPNVTFYTVNTTSETDLNIFVDKDQKWAVFCFRGTETETLRDWLTSILVAAPQAFNRQRELLVRSRYYKEMLAACRKYHLKPNPFAGVRMTALDMALFLSDRHCKIYCTGHSLGGGLATLLGAYLTTRNELPLTGVITFGSPPVAASEGAFVRWYSSKGVARSWRFVNGNEFAPMAPPLPYTTNYEFSHVKQLVNVQNMQDIDPPVLDWGQTIAFLDSLDRHGNLLSIIVDHNPALILRALDHQIPEQERQT